MDVYAKDIQRSMYLACIGSSHIEDLDSLGQREFDILAQLFQQRRSLPVYREGLWCCYDCNFHSTDIEEVSKHLLTVHHVYQDMLDPLGDNTEAETLLSGEYH